MIQTLTALTETAQTLALAGGAETDPTQIVFPEDSFWGQLRGWTESLPETLQWLGVIAVSAIPFFESYGGGFLGVLIGMPLWAAIIAAVVGNMLSLTIVVYTAHGMRSAVVKGREPREMSEGKRKRREKAKRLFDKFGVPGVSLLGPFALPSQITAPLMVSFGANRNLVLIWMLVSVIVWGTGFALLGIGFLNLISG